MKPAAIVYVSKTGHTKQYAFLLGKELDLPVYSYDEAMSGLPGESPIIFFGWIHASHVKGFSGAAKKFSVSAVCGVGLCDTGTLIPEVRKASSIPDSIPLFTLQGGFDSSKLKGIDKMMISMLIKGLESQKQRSEQDERMLELLRKDANYVSTENLAEVLQWYKTVM